MYNITFCSKISSFGGVVHFCRPTETDNDNINNNNNEVLIPENVYFYSPFLPNGSVHDAITSYDGAKQ